MHLLLTYKPGSGTGQPSGAGPNALLADGWPARILGIYWPTWEAGRVPIVNVPPQFNVIYIFVANFNADGSISLPLNPGDLTIPQLQTLANRGQKTILSVGGSASHFDFANRTQSQNFVNSFRALVDGTLGGLVYGVDWNNYEGATSINVTEMIWICQQLRIAYGPSFAITSPPAGANTGGAAVNGFAPGSAVDLNAMGAMSDAGVLNWVSPQYYQYSLYKIAGSIKQLNDRWVARLSELQACTAITANCSFADSPTLAEATREWDAVIAAHPNERGLVCWNAFTDTTTIVDAGELSEGAAEGGNLWGITMRARLDGLYAPAPAPAPPPSPSLRQGINLSGMEASQASIRTTPLTQVNIDLTIPRAADLTFLAAQGFGRHRLCIPWELVQPVLASSIASASVLSAHGISSSGAMVPEVMGWILDVLDAAAAASIQVILDLHNFGRYKDFVYQSDGSVIGFNPGSTTVFPYTSDAGQTITRVMALATGTPLHPTISQADYNAFWTKFVGYVEAGTGRHIKAHGGLAGYGLMNEPHDLPVAGSNVDGSGPEDLSIWSTFAQGAVNTIRALDAASFIFVAGNDKSVPWSGNPGGSYVVHNPTYPLTGTNLVYEAHYQLDSQNTGINYDWTTESVTAASSAGESSSHGVTTSTGSTRAQYCVDFITNTGKDMVVSSSSMPNGDPNWQTSMDGSLASLFSHGIGHTLWVGGNHWKNRGIAISGIPGFKLGLTLLPPAYGVMHKAAARTKFDIFADANTNWGPAGTVCTVTLYTKGYSPASLTVNLAKSSTGKVTTISGSSGAATIVVGSNTGLAIGNSVSGTGIAAGAKITNIAGTTVTLSPVNSGAVSGNGTFTGTLSAASAVIPAGANQSVTFTYTTIGTEDATVTFSNQVVNPGVMHFYSMDPVTFAATDKTIAGRACLAKYGAFEWLAKNGFTDYMGGVPATSSKTVRAIHNSGFGEVQGNSHAMLNWINPLYGAGGPVTMPVFDVDSAGKIVTKFNSSFGLWNKKVQANAGGISDPNPINTLPYTLGDSHFHVVGLSVPGAASNGTVFVANNEQGLAKSELSLVNGTPKMLLRSLGGTVNAATASNPLSVNTYHNVTMRSTAGAQVLRVDKTQINTMAVTPGADKLTSMEIGFTYDNLLPAFGFIGSLYGVITGKGNPTDGELGVLEDYLSLVTSTLAGTGPADYPSGVAALTAWIDPSLFSTMQLSSVSGGSVTGVGNFIGVINSRAPGTVNFTTGDADRFVLRQDVNGNYNLDTGDLGWSSNAASGGSSTAFFFIAAAQFNGAANTQNQHFYMDFDSGTEPNKGYRLFYDFLGDVWSFSAGNGSARTQMLAGSGLGLNAGSSPFVVMIWDDGTNLNFQINNGTVQQLARPVVVAGTVNPTLWVDTGLFQDCLAKNYGTLWAKNSALNSTDRAGIKTWLGAKAGLTL